MSILRTCAALASLLVIARGAAADDLPPQSSGVVMLRQCLIEYERAATLGANQTGRLQKSEVRLGDRVRAGQVVGRMQDDDLRADLDYRSAVAASDVEVRMNEKNYEWSLVKLKMLENLRSNKYSSEEEYRLQKLAAENAKLSVEDARNRRHLAQLQYRIAEAGVRVRQLVSPIDGIVVDVAKTEGESLSPNDPVYRIVDPGLLRISGSVDVVDLARIGEGDRVQIIPEIGGAELPIERQQFAGRVSFISRQIDPATQTCLVVAQVENRPERLRAGLRCTMSITPGSAPKGAAEPDPRPAAEPGAKAAGVRRPAPGRAGNESVDAARPLAKSGL